MLGPLARCADDLELALDTIAGPSPQDARAWRLDLPAPRHKQLSGFRVAIDSLDRYAQAEAAAREGRLAIGAVPAV